MKIDIIDKKQGIVVYVDGLFVYRSSQSVELEEKHIEALIRVMKLNDIEIITNGIVD